MWLSRKAGLQDCLGRTVGRQGLLSQASSPSGSRVAKQCKAGWFWGTIGTTCTENNFKEGAARTQVGGGSHRQRRASFVAAPGSACRLLPSRSFSPCSKHLAVSRLRKQLANLSDLQSLELLRSQKWLIHHEAVHIWEASLQWLARCAHDVRPAVCECVRGQPQKCSREGLRVGYLSVKS